MQSSQRALGVARSLTSIPAFSPAKDAASDHSGLSSSYSSALMVGSTNDPVEREADTMAAHLTGAPAQHTSRSTAAASNTEAPPIVHEALRTGGEPLDTGTRSFFEPRFGRDLSAVRIHNDALSQQSARPINARAYTVGQDVVFASGQYQPHSAQGQRLLAHELSHTVQHSAHGSSPTALHRQEATPQKPEEKKPQPIETTVSVSWDDLLNRKLTLPSLLQPRQQQPLLPSPGTLTLGGQPQTGSTLAPGSLFNFPPLTSSSPLGSVGLIPPTLSPSTPPGPNLTGPTPGAGQPAQPAPAAPSRLSVINSGSLSVGLRLGFPNLENTDKPGTPPSGAQQALQQAQIMNQIITGQVPSAWQSLDKGKLAGAVWGIFSTYIAPDAARKITSSLSGKIGKSGPSYELDAVLLTDFSGGGISFTLRH